MTETIVPATAEFEGQQLKIRVQVNNDTHAAGEEDPERDVSIFRRRPGEPFDLSDVGTSIGAIANAVTSAIAKVAPDEAEVEFGVDVGVESGQLTSLLVKGSGNATIKVRLSWTKDDGPASAAVTSHVKA